MRKRTLAADGQEMTGAPVHVFIPYAKQDGALVSPYFETPDMRGDVAAWMAACRRDWRWVVVTQDSIDPAVASAKACGATVLNLCDGDEINGYPGLSAVRALQEAKVPFTGARLDFYEISTSKLAMKKCFTNAAVATAPFVVISDLERDVERAASELGFPFFLKPDISFGAAGITVHSLVRSVAEARQAIRRLTAGMHDCNFSLGGIYAEPYLDGREFTVLCVADTRAEEGVRVLEPGERVFHATLPEDQRFLTYERVCGEYALDERLPEGVDLYAYAPAPAAQRTLLVDLARRAYLSVKGSGYARVDIRTAKRTDLAYVLEVNANCALSSDDTSSVGSILAMSGIRAAELIALILADGEARFS